MFGWSLIRTSEYKELQHRSHAFGRVMECYRWFSGWKDLDIVWDYILGKPPWRTISHARDCYAGARQTDCYGKPKESKQASDGTGRK